jgi:abortive infection alpha-like protein
LRLSLPVPDAWRLTKTTVSVGVRLLRRQLVGVEQLALPAPAVSVEQQLDHLLERSVGQSTSGGRLELYRALLGQLVPDEARILSALSDGRSAAVVQIVPRSGRSAGAAPLLENASSVGRSAGVALAPLVPTYVTHLVQLGLVELCPDDPELELEYELLMAETIVRDALVQGRRPGRLSPRVVRQTLRLSELGRDLWAACRPAERPPA